RTLQNRTLARRISGRQCDRTQAALSGKELLLALPKPLQGLPLLRDVPGGADEAAGAAPAVAFNLRSDLQKAGCTGARHEPADKCHRLAAGKGPGALPLQDVEIFGGNE